MFKKLLCIITAIILCMTIMQPRDSDALYWGSKNEAHLRYHAVMDSSSSLGTGTTDSLARTVLRHDGPGKIYIISVKSENSTGADPFVIIDIDGVIDTLQILNTTSVAYISPYDTPDDDTAAIDGYSYSTTYGRMDVWFNEYCSIKLYSEDADATKEALIFVSYGLPEESHGLSGGEGAVHYKYNIIADTTSYAAASLATVLDYSGQGIIYALGLATENFTGADPYVVLTIDGLCDTLVVSNSTDPFWLVPWDTPDDDTAALDYYNLAPDSTYHPANIFFENNLKVQIYTEDTGNDTDKQTLIFMSYGTAEE